MSNPPQRPASAPPPRPAPGIARLPASPCHHLGGESPCLGGRTGEISTAVGAAGSGGARLMGAEGPTERVLGWWSKHPSHPACPRPPPHHGARREARGTPGRDSASGVGPGCPSWPSPTMASRAAAVPGAAPSSASWSLPTAAGSGETGEKAFPRRPSPPTLRGEEGRPGATVVASEPGACTARLGFGVSLGHRVLPRATLGAGAWSQLRAGTGPARHGVQSHWVHRGSLLPSSPQPTGDAVPSSATAGRGDVGEPTVSRHPACPCHGHQWLRSWALSLTRGMAAVSPGCSGIPWAGELCPEDGGAGGPRHPPEQGCAERWGHWDRDGAGMEHHNSTKPAVGALPMATHPRHRHRRRPCPCPHAMAAPGASRARIRLPETRGSPVPELVYPAAGWTDAGVRETAGMRRWAPGRIGPCSAGRG